MGADAYWRVDVDEPASDELLAKLGAYVVSLGEQEVSAEVSADRRVFFGMASFEDGPTDELVALSEAVRDLTGGTLRQTDDFGAMGRPFDLPDDGTDLATFAPADAPRPEPEPEPAGLDQALAKWRKGARSRGKWADLRDAMKPFVGHARFDRELVRDMLQASAFDDRGSSATTLLADAPGEHITAALVERIRRDRGASDFHSARVDALRALARREPERCRASLMIEARLDPALTYIEGEIVDLAQRGLAPIGLLAGSLDDAHKATSPLYRWRTDAELSDDVRAYVAALVHHDEAEVATAAAAVLVRFDLDAGLQALASVDLTKLDSLFFMRFPHEALASWRKRATRRGCTPEVAEELRAEVLAMLAERGLEPLARQPWAEVRAGLAADVPDGDWELEEADLVAGHGAFLAAALSGTEPEPEAAPSSAPPPPSGEVATPKAPEPAMDDVDAELAALSRQLEELIRPSSRASSSSSADRAERRAAREARRAERAARRSERNQPVVRAMVPEGQVDALLAALTHDGEPERAVHGDEVLLSFTPPGDGEEFHIQLAWAAAGLAAAGHRVTVRGPARPREVQLLGDEAVESGTNRHDGGTHRSLLRRLSSILGIEDGGDRLVDRRVSRARERQLEAADAEAAREAAGHTAPALPGGIELSFAALSLSKDLPDDDGDVRVRGTCTVALAGEGVVSQLVLRHVVYDDDGVPIGQRERSHDDGAAPGERVDIRPTVYAKNMFTGGHSVVWIDALAGNFVNLGPVPLPAPGEVGGEGTDVELAPGVFMTGWSVARGLRADDDGDWRIELTIALANRSDTPCAGIEVETRLLRDGQAFEDRTSSIDYLLAGAVAGIDRRLYLRSGHAPEGVEVALTVRLRRVVATLRSEPQPL